MRLTPPITPAPEETSAPAKRSRYGMAAIWVGAASCFWSLLDTPLEPINHDKAGMIASVIGLIFAYGAYQNGQGKRAFAGVLLGVAGFVLNLLFPAFG
jgi:hypothetical protein